MAGSANWCWYFRFLICRDLRGCAFTVAEVRKLLAGPDRTKVAGARDYALLLLLNKFKYRAKVNDAHSTQAGRWAWDVFFVKR